MEHDYKPKGAIRAKHYLAIGLGMASIVPGYIAMDTMINKINEENALPKTLAAVVATTCLIGAGTKLSEN